nr:arginine repressor C-terminal-like domain-containing protein [Tanacetum cinerariifolium]GEZ86880.1 arginine repressor C-terminal-like domain-containing protein [Tanacetum cinerariifolium]GEZ87626.1 arginine repressor C-terminal-like domain-containing protein [Tanacetum cinerariifolium]
MAQMGFGVKWRKWIYACLSSASVSILINSSPPKEFPMKRSLRQSDPLSSFLFLIVAENMQVMITDSCNKGIYKGLSLYNDGANISLLQGSFERRREYNVSLQLFARLPSILLLRYAREKKYEEDWGLDRSD